MIEVIDMKKNKEILHPYVIEKIHKTKGLILIFTGKKSYSGGIVCKNCGYIPYCKNCDIPVSWHKNNLFILGICHICRTTYDYPLNCPICGSSFFQDFSYGGEKIKEIIGIKNTLLIDSKDLDNDKKINQFYENIKNAKIIISTPILTSIKIPAELVIVQNGDLGLNIASYDSNRRNFIYLYEIVNFYDNVIIQSYSMGISLEKAIKKDLVGMKNIEIEFRKKNGYPPFGNLVKIIYKDEIEERLHKKINKIYFDLKFLKEKLNLNVEIYPTPASIYKIYGKYRYNIILKGDDTFKILDEGLNLGIINLKEFKIDINPVEF